MLHYKETYHYFHGVIKNLLKNPVEILQANHDTTTGNQECCSSLTTTNNLCLLYILYYSPIAGVGCGLKALLSKLTKLILQIGCLSYHITSWRKSVLIQILSVQIPEAFHQHEKAEKTNDLGEIA